MNKLIAWVSSLPKWAQILLSVVLVGAVICAFIYFMFGDQLSKKAATAQADNGTKYVEVSDALPGQDLPSSKLDLYRNYGSDDYWEQLDEDGSSPSRSELATNVGNKSDELDPNEYSEYERYLIQNGYMSKKDVDERHMKNRAKSDVMNDAIAQAWAQDNTPQRSPEEIQKMKDSMYFERMNKAMEIAMRYSPAGGPSAAAETVSEPESKPEPQPRRIDVTSGGNGSTMPTEDMRTDDIISSLDDVGSGGGIIRYSDGKVKVLPTKATFLKTEKLSSGQRVTIRLMQDLILSSGMRIPANTHISGTCNLGNRLEIHVTMIHYAGKMFPADLTIYDNDGTEGIYCPIIENKMRQKGENVASSSANTAGNVLASMLGRSYAGIAASALTGVGTAAISEISRSIARDGTVSINVSSGYEFYIYENLKENNG